MAEYIRPFDLQSDAVNLAVTGSSQVLAVNSTAIGTRSVRVANIGSQTIFIKFGTANTTVSATSGTPMIPNSVETFLLRNEVTHIAAIAGSTGSTMYVTVGEGA
jgi:hypothetical protein